VRAPLTAEHVHGDTGLRGLQLPEPTTPARPQHGVDYLIDALRAATPGEITLCLLGPATNVAMALFKAPDIAARIAEVVWMAGARGAGGNITPAAEFNVHADPDAAKVLLGSGVPLTLAPLDLTRQVRLTPTRLARLRQVDTAAARAMAVLFSGDDDAPLHDPCVIAHLLQPGLFTGRHINVKVETSSPLTLGMTVADWFGVTGRAANATWLNQADASGFFDLLFERLARLP
jgi:purine nucleosidase